MCFAVPELIKLFWAISILFRHAPALLERLLSATLIHFTGGVMGPGDFMRVVGAVLKTGLTFLILTTLFSYLS